MESEELGQAFKARISTVNKRDRKTIINRGSRARISSLRSFTEETDQSVDERQPSIERKSRVKHRFTIFPIEDTHKNEESFNRKGSVIYAKKEIFTPQPLENKLMKPQTLKFKNHDLDEVLRGS